MDRFLVAKTMYFKGIAVAITLSIVIMMSDAHDTKTQNDANTPTANLFSSFEIVWSIRVMPINAVTAFRESDTLNGDILVWNLSSKEFKTLSHGHTRIIFNITIDPTVKKMITTSMDRQVLLWNSETHSLLGCVPSLGGYVYSVTTSLLDPYSIIYGVGDNVIRVWNTRDSNQPYDTIMLWQGIKSKVTVVVCHPRKEGVVGFGTDDGHVGIYNIASKKFEVSISYHKKTVYSLAWGPNCGEDANDNDSAGGNCLYSCGGEGSILIHSMNRLQNKARDMNAIVRKTNSIKERFPSRSDVEWRKDFKFVAVGNDDGSVEIFSSPNLQSICIILVHRKIINCMKWHHQFDISHITTGNAFANWLATGSSDNYVCVTDISQAIDGKTLGQKQIVIKEKFRYFNHHSQRITSLSWSPHSMELLASSSYDGTVQIWNVSKNEPIANYRGHLGRVLCVEWSLVDPDVIYSGSEDFTLRRWTISSCKHVMPTDVKKQVTGSRKSEKPKAKTTAKPQTASEPTGQPAVEESLVNQRQCGEPKDAVVDSSDDGLGARLISTEDSTVSPSDLKSRLTQEDALKRSSCKGDTKKKKPKSLFPLSATQNHKQKAASQKECIMLAKHLKEGSSMDSSVGEFVPGKAEYVNLGLFGDRPSAFKMFTTEGQNHLLSGNCEQQLHLELWKGNLEGALSICKQKGELNEMVVAMSPIGGFDVWQSTMKAYADQLASKGDYFAAASYYVAVNKVKEAIEMFKAQNMFKEAIALAKVRLSSRDPVLIELYRQWGEKQIAEGCYENAAKCYIAAGDCDTAIKILARKGDVSSLKTAAQVAIVYDNIEVAESYLQHCAEALLTDFKWTEASQVIEMMRNPKGYTFLAIVHELTMRFLSGTESDVVLSFTASIERNGHYIPSDCQFESVNTHTKSDLLQNLKKEPNKVMEIACDVFHRKFDTTPLHGLFENDHWQLSQSFNAGKVITVNDLKVAMLSISFEVAMGIKSLLEGNSYHCLLHWLQTLEIAYSSHQFEALEKLYKLLLPRDFTTVELITASVLDKSSNDEERQKAHSLFYNFDGYHKTAILFHFWWKIFPTLIRRWEKIKDGLEGGFSNYNSIERTSLSEASYQNIDIGNFLAFLSGISSSLLLTSFGRIAQLKSCIKSLDHNILEAKIKRQLRQHIISKVGKTKKKKPVKGDEILNEGDSKTNWRASDKSEDDKKDTEGEVVQKSGEQKVDILGNEITVIDDESFQQMEIESERFKKELQSWLNESADLPFPDCFENAKILLHIICSSIKSLPQSDIVSKLTLLAKDIIKWGLSNSLSSDDANCFERFSKRLGSQ
eukprot:gene326-9985_t